MKFLATVYQLADLSSLAARWLHSRRAKAWLELRRVGQRRVIARDDRLAAGKAWILLVGQPRCRELMARHAVSRSLDSNGSLRSVAGQLRPTSLGPGGFLLDNGLQAWIVKPVRQPSGRDSTDRTPPTREERMISHLLDWPSDPCDIFRALWNPEEN